VDKSAKNVENCGKTPTVASTRSKRWVKIIHFFSIQKKKVGIFAFLYATQGKKHSFF